MSFDSPHGAREQAAKLEEKKKRWDVSGYSDIKDSALPEDVQTSLVNVVFDRNDFFKHEDILYTFPQPRVANNEWLECPAEQQHNVRHNLALLEQCSGHRGSVIRRVVENGSHKATQYMSRLFEWADYVSKEFIIPSGPNKDEPLRGFKKVYFSAATDNDSGGKDSEWELQHSTLTRELPEILMDVYADAGKLYERLSFIERFPDTTRDTYAERLVQETANALGVDTDQVRWIQLVPLVFNASNPRAKDVIKHLGFLPSELSSGRGEKKFNSLGPEPIVRTIETLKASEDEDDVKAQQYERARLLNRLLLSGNNAKQIRFKDSRPVALDTNGIKISLKNFHAHIPYGLVSPELINLLADPTEAWSSEKNGAYIVAQEMYLENGNCDKLLKALAASEKFFYREAGFASVEEFGASLLQDPEALAENFFQKKLIIPGTVMGSLFSVFSEQLGTTEFALMRYARKTVDLMKEHKKKKIGGAVTDEQVLNDTFYYVVKKIVLQVARKSGAFIFIIDDDHELKKRSHDVTFFRKAHSTRQRRDAAGKDNIEALVARYRGEEIEILFNANRHFNKREKLQLSFISFEENV